MNSAAVERLPGLSVTLAMIACAGACGGPAGSAGGDYFDSDGSFSLQLPCNLLLFGDSESSCITSEPSAMVVVPSSNDWDRYIPRSGSIPPGPEDLALLRTHQYMVNAIGQVNGLLFGQCLIRNANVQTITFHWAYDTTTCRYVSDLDREVVTRECGVAAIPWDSMRAPELFARRRIK